MLRYLPLLLLASVASAQTPEIVTKIEAKLDAERAAQRTEDVEILRRLLNKACGLPDKASVRVEYPEKFGPVISGPEVARLIVGVKELTVASSPVGPFDGVYLPGAGVVFTLHVPSGAAQTDGNRVGLRQTCGACHTAVTAGDAHHISTPGLAANNCTTCHDAEVKPEKPLSEWERTKLDVRGESPKPTAKKPKEKKPPVSVCEWGDLTGQVSAVLAANAKNVRHLPEKEGVTVVVTFDEVGDGGPKVVPHHPSPAQPVFTADEVKQLSLADLNLKAGKYAEAVQAYSAVLGRFTKKEWKMTAPEGLTPQQRNQFSEETEKKVRELFKSYAKALVLADQPDAAKKALELATEFIVLEVTVTTVPAKNTAPAKLILTLSKADADAKEPKKLVKVERANFPK